MRALIQTPKVALPKSGNVAESLDWVAYLDKLSQTANSYRTINNIVDSLGIGDNSTDNTRAAFDAVANGGSVYVPAGIFKTTYPAYNSYEGRFWGSGQLKDANGAGCKRAYEYTVALTPPSSQGHEDAQQTAFSGDDSRVAGPMANPGEFYVGPNATGLTIATNEQYPELCPRRFYETIEGGFNGTILGGGRSQLSVYRTILQHNGKGDSCMYNGIGFVNGTNPVSAASFLECPAISVVNASLAAQGDGKYLNTMEFEHNDGGFDAAAIAMVARFNRTNDTGALGVVHMGHLVRSNGTKAIDAIVSGGGKTKIFLDASIAELNASGTYKQAAAVYRSGMRFYWNAPGTTVGSYGLMPDDLGDAWFGYDSSAWQWVVGGGTALTLSAGNLTVNAGCISIVDGQVTPGASAGFGHLYIDVSDGDLKIIFGDGTVKTIVTD